jgi:hypothetical protein
MNLLIVKNQHTSFSGNIIFNILIIKFRVIIAKVCKFNNLESNHNKH